MHRFEIFERFKTIDERFLQHSEFVRKLGVPSLFGFGSVLSMSFGIFVIIPHVVTIAGPLAMLSLLLAFIVMIVSVMHVNELMSSMPKTCLLYNFIYACFGELPAFFTAWTALLDFIIILVIIAKSWSDHTKLLFGGFFHEYLVIKLSFSVNNEILEDEIDGFAMLIIIFSIVILCCNLRVSGTIAFVMLIVSGLATSSTILVGFFNANPNYWLSSKFFQRGMHGMISGASFLSLSYAGIEALTSLLEETHNPRRRLPFIFSFITFLYSLLIFITIMIFTLTNDSTNFSIQMLPDIFNNVKIPAARYFMTIGAFFGLFAATFVALIPASRLILSMANDNLLPSVYFSRITKKSCIPYNAVISAGIMAILLLFIRKNSLIDIAALNLPIRFVLMGSLVYLQHFRSDPIGFTTEIAKYRKFYGKYSKTCKDSGDLKEESEKCSDGDDESSTTSSEYLLMYFSQKESQHYQLKLKEANEHTFLLNVNNNDQFLSKSSNESNSKYKTFSCKTEENEYLYLPINEKISDENVVLSKFEIFNHGHNCIRSPCSPAEPILQGNSKNHANQRFHLFENEVPEFPYCWEYNGKKASSPTDNVNIVYRRSIYHLVAFIALSIVEGILIRIISFEKIFLLLAAFITFLSLICLTIYVSLQPTNRSYSNRQCRTPLFPYLTLLSIFISLIMITSSTLVSFVKNAIWLAIGCIVYRCYAYKYSNERRFASSNILTFTQASTDQNCSEVIPILLASEDATQ